MEYGFGQMKRKDMTFNKNFYILAKNLLTLSLIILVFEFSCPQHTQAQGLNSAVLGPVLTKLETLEKSNQLPMTVVKKPKMVRWVMVTAYSSTVDQCDDTPFITANGKWVYDGLVAANFLRFGTMVKFPDYFGDKIFTVNDRMNQKYNSRIDIWMPTREQAIEFGARYLKVEIY